MDTETTTIGQWMTASPHSIGIDQSLLQARTMMQRFRIRHLPVLDGGSLVGVVSDRDLSLIATFDESDPRKIPIEEVMSREVWSVAPNAALAEVVGTMAERRFGCAVIMEQHRVTGIFTTTDACKALANLLSSPRAPGAPTTP